MATNSSNIIKSTEPLQQGDTYKMKFKYKEGTTPEDIPSGQDLIAAFYDRKWNPIESYKLSNGTIVYLGDHVYQLEVLHEVSMKMLGTVYFEITIAKPDKSFVDHAKQIVEYSSEQRRNNALL